MAVYIAKVKLTERDQLLMRMRAMLSMGVIRRHQLLQEYPCNQHRDCVSSCHNITSGHK